MRDATSVSYNREGISNFLGLTGLYLFSLFAFLGTAGAEMGLLMMLLALMLDAPNAWSIVRRDPVFPVFLASAIYLAWRAYDAASEFPSTSSLQWGDGSGWLNLWFLLFVAWWLDGNTRRLLICLGLAFLGFVTNALMEIDWSNWQALFHGQRYGFGFVAIMSGLLAGIGTIGLIVFAKRLWGGSKNRKQFALRVALWLITLLFLLQILLVSQSRGAWIATAAVLPPLLAVYVVRFARRHGVRRLLVPSLIALVVGSLAMGVMAINSGMLERRVAYEDALFANLVRGVSVEQVPYTSVGRRIHMLHFGFRRWLERPFLGWGPGTKVTRLFGKADFKDPLQAKEAEMLTPHPDLHNSYLVVLTRLGVLGALLFGILPLMVIRATWVAHRRRHMPTDVFLFLLAAFGANALWCLIDFRMVHIDYRELVLLLGGAAYTYHIARRKQSISHASAHSDVSNTSAMAAGRAHRTDT